MEHRLSELFIKVDWAAADGASGQRWRQVTAEAGQPIYFPDLLGIVQFLQIMALHQVDEDFVRRLETVVACEDAAASDMKNALAAQVFGLRQQISAFIEAEELREDKEYLESYRKVLNARKAKLQQKVRAKPHNQRFKHELQLIEEDFQRLRNNR